MSNPTALRLDPSTLDLVTAIRGELSARAGGAPVSAAHVLRLALGRGIDALQAELGIARVPGRPVARVPSAEAPAPTRATKRAHRGR